MIFYHVSWHIELDAETPEQAALLARNVQVTPGTDALEFEVSEFGHDEHFVKVDLSEMNPRIDTDISAELLAACIAQHEAIDLLFAMLINRGEFLPSESGQPWEACKLGHATIEKAKSL